MRDLRLNLARLLGVSAISIMVALVGREIGLKVRRGKVKRSKDRKLDIALEDSMDCSDPVAQY